MSAADQFPSEPFESSSTAEDAVTVGTHHVDDVISASAHTEPTTEAPTPTTPACIDVAPDESISMDDLLTETVHQVDQESAAFIHQMETDLLCGLLARKWCSIGCELVQSYVGTEMEYIRILQGKESQTDDEYAEEDFGVEDAADNDDYADKDFENLVKQFRVDEKMCYYPFPSKISALLYILIHGPHPIGSTALMFIWFILKECGIKVPSLSTVRAFIVLGVDMPQKDGSTCTTALVIAPLTLIICDNPHASELLGHLGSTALKYCRICMADKNDSPNIICEQRNLMQAQCRL
ncbi:hypothetical protein EMCRGX_G010252 [Ephydatia muelleri]